MRITKSKFLSISIQILYMLCFGFFFFSSKMRGELIYDYIDTLFPWIIGLIGVNILTFRLTNFSIYDFGMWFIIMSYLFMFGIVFTQKFDFTSTLLWNPISNYTREQLFTSLSFAILCIISFSIGYTFLYKNTKNEVELQVNTVEEKPNYNMFYIGVVLFSIGFFSRVYTDMNIIKNTLMYNSYSAYVLASSSGILDDFVVFFIPGIAFLVFSNVLTKKKGNFFIFFALIYFFITMSLTGSRKIQIFSILDLLLIYLASQKGKIKIRRIFFTVLIGILLLNLMVTIRDNRFDISSILPIYFENLMTGKLFATLLGEILTETGITLYSITNIIRCVPDIFSYQYGMTFIKTIPSVLPIGWLLTDFFNSVSSTTYINKYLNLPVGSSLFGDFYWNFGLIGGIIASFIFGLLICILIRKIDTVTQKGKAIYFSLFGYLIILVRAELFDVFRSIVYICVLSAIVNRLVDRVRSGRMS